MSTIKTPAELAAEYTALPSSVRERIAKRWAEANGYKGGTGGWIYNTAKGWKPVCQGWIGFAHMMRHRIVADIEAGTFVPTWRIGTRERR